MHAGHLLLSALPSALAVHLYSVPNHLSLAEADETNDCVLPDNYHILNFRSTSGSGGTNLSAFGFTFKDTKTKVTTPCEFNSTSKATAVTGSTARYACDDSSVEFIWQDKPDYLTMIEYVCPGTDGSPEWEVSGSAKIYLNCPSSGGACTTNSTDQKALFVSLNPVRTEPSRI
ncbi:hypothetical protein B0T10DRAFT_454332 [Thelonectria olida]|uniref:AA1-like domain-containing protein n=1 Tax=Thelonectria olida TaxID=1576542 RepID=A0A9P8WKL1_9HYPO|nr:hypothetical protein B0T10DRAFT_454332 [Thelonectria olida]